jgi:hypothetical protein
MYIIYCFFLPTYEKSFGFSLFVFYLLTLFLTNATNHIRDRCATLGELIEISDIYSQNKK